MPANTMSGSSCNNPVIAKCTQSVGVPSILMKPLSVWLTRKGLSKVSELLAPLRFRSGATTVSRARCPSAFAKAISPWAE
jgi:hypothetical protein